MCGRFTLTQDRKSIVDDLDVAEWEATAEHRPRYNVAPTQAALTLCWSAEASGSHRLVRSMRWGLIPSWAKDASIASKLINARSETITEKPSFRNLVARRRCALLTDGFFEWQKLSQGPQPHYIHAPGRALLPMAGLWDTWRGPDGEWLTTCSILTTTARPDIAWLHDRMPVILERGDLDAWIDVDHHDASSAIASLRPYTGPLETEPVSKLVNSPRFDSEEVIRKVEPAVEAQGSLFG